MTTTYAGICRGGPLDGRLLEHFSKRYRVVIPIMRPLQVRPLDEAPTKASPIFDSEQSEYVFVLGQWIWQKRKEVTTRI